MSLKRAAAPLATQALQLLRPVPSPALSRAQICPRCLLALDAPPRPRQPSRRHFAAAAQRAQSLETHAPPRNAGIPDTSIAGGNPKVDGARQGVEFSIPEGAAQQPQPPTSANTASSGPGSAVGSVATPEPSSPSTQQQQQQPGKSKRPKLRPRKAAMTLTPAAVAQLQGLLSQPDPKLIRVGVKNKGCSGLAYHLEYVDKPGAFDEAVEQDGVRVLVDSKALFSIIGSEMDWIEDKLSRRFVFKNPNITEQCGCGESFSTG